MTALNKAQLNFVDTLIDSFDKEIIPWRATWDTPIFASYNEKNKNAYRGFNQLTLYLTALSNGWDDPRWMTFKQANELGYRIKKGSIGTDVLHFSIRHRETKKAITIKEYNVLEQAKKEDYCVATKTYRVFNAMQIEGLEPFDPKSNHIYYEDEKAALFVNTFVSNTKLTVKHGGDKAYYVPAEDCVQLPAATNFWNEQAYYAALLHECAHATMHSSRLDREGSFKFGSEEYALEELRAELTSVFLTMDLGLHFDESHERNHRSYIQWWKNKIKNDPQVIFKALADAQKIREYMLEKGEYSKIYAQANESIEKHSMLTDEGYIPTNIDNVSRLSMEEYYYRIQHQLKEKETAILFKLGVPVVVRCGFIDKNDHYYTNLQVNKKTQNMSEEKEMDWFNEMDIKVADHRIVDEEDLLILKDSYAHGYLDPSFVQVDDMPQVISVFRYLTDPKYHVLEEDVCYTIQEEMVSNIPLTIEKLMDYKNQYLTDEVLEKAASKKAWQFAAKYEGKDPLTIIKQNVEITPSMISTIEEQEVKTLALAQEKKKETVVINLFAGPGAGKTTAAWELASKLKKLNYITEYVPEYAKELVWDEKHELLDGTLEHQKLLLNEQSHRIKRLLGKVDFIVTDAPELINLNFLKCDDPKLSEEYQKMVLQDFNGRTNFNLFIKRGEYYETAGRVHTLEESINLDNSIQKILKDNNIFYGSYEHNESDKIIENCVITYKKAQAVLEETVPTKDNPKISLDDLKNSISIIEYARDQLNFSLVKESRGIYRIEEHDSCKIYPNNTFYRFSNSVGGSIIDFIKHFESCDTIEAIEKMKSYYEDYHPEVRFDTSKSSIKAINLKGISNLTVPDKNETNKHVYSYLTKTRGIKPSIVKEYLDRKILYEDARKNCVFVGKFNNVINYATLRASSKSSKFKQDISGSIKEVGIYVSNHASTLIVNESVIDQMSYMSLVQNHQLYDYLSIQGAANAVSAVRFHMLKRAESNNVKKIVFALDNDKAGSENTVKAIDYIKKIILILKHKCIFQKIKILMKIC